MTATIRVTYTLDASAPAHRLVSAPTSYLSPMPPQWERIWTPADAYAAAGLAEALEAELAAADPEDAAHIARLRVRRDQARREAQHRPDPPELAPHALRLEPHLWHRVTVRAPQHMPAWLRQGSGFMVSEPDEMVGVRIERFVDGRSATPLVTISSPYRKSLPDGLPVLEMEISMGLWEIVEGAAAAIRRVGLPALAEGLIDSAHIFTSALRDAAAKMTAHPPALSPTELANARSVAAEMLWLADRLDD